MAFCYRNKKQTEKCHLRDFDINMTTENWTMVYLSYYLIVIKHTQLEKTHLYAFC